MLGIAALVLFIIVPHSLFMDKVLKEYLSMVVILLINLIPNMNISSMRKLIEILAKNSMGIYLFHHVILAIIIMIPTVKHCLDTTDPYIGGIVLFGVVFIISILLSMAFNKSKITRFLIGSKIN